MKFIVTVDTEADNQWAEDAGISLENIRALPRFQKLCERFSIRPTYFTTYEVMHDPESREMLKGWHTRKAAEVGAHLHPWTTPPFSDKEHGKAFPNELSDESLRVKLIMLTNSIKEGIGDPPASYRSGRWGFDERQAALLKELGYVGDFSITPGISWKNSTGLEGGAGGPDFKDEPVAPHRLPNGIVEVPMTILRSGIFGRLRWLRIFPNTTRARLKSVLSAALKKKLPAVVFMIHSSELSSGMSPYVKTEADLERVYGLLTDLFELTKEKGFESVTATEFVKTFV